ncbi:MAG: RIP metalloprotease RseP [Bacteroidetes bacterium RBG_19FT_COMBO_42_10]|nr:MAG: RIP metalloprotease RseP [Bacteroidetes bacterium RBG_19FT_COMBO_42_10]
MTVLIKIIQLLLSLSILVIIHELGHFMFARIFKTRVEKLYLFFDPWFSLFKYKRGDTEYGIGWLPLGGYAKISGMIDESLDIEQMKQPPQPWEFRSKKSWQRLLIMTSGVLFNFILAMLIYVTVLFAWGETYLPTSSVKYGIVTDSAGFALGLKNGDKILSIDNQYIDNFYAITSDIVLNDRKTIQVERDGQIVNIEVTLDYIKRVLKREGQIEPRAPFGPYIITSYAKESPARSAGVLVDDELVGLDNIKFTWFDEFQKYLARNKNKPVTMNLLRKGEPVDIQVTPTDAGILGILSNLRTIDNIFELKTIHYGFFQSIPAGISKGFKSIVDYLKQFRLIFSRHTKAYESLGGFITIGSIFPGVWDWQSFWELTAFLSIILAVMNILPIPGLDGGHVMFLLFEVITGRKPSDKFLEYAQIAGMIILFSLLIFANGNDIIRLFRK